MATIDDFDRLTASITAWACSRSDIVALAVVGSWARGTARPDSDIDLIILATEPRTFCDGKDWLADIDWGEWRVAGWRDVAYGAAWSCHVRLEPSCEVELTFCAVAWATTDPLDPDTAGIVSKGCRILLDKDGLLKNLTTAAPQ